MIAIISETNHDIEKFKKNFFVLDKKMNIFWLKNFFVGLIVSGVEAFERKFDGRKLFDIDYVCKVLCNFSTIDPDRFLNRICIVIIMNRCN